MKMMLFMPTFRWAKTVHIDPPEPDDADRTPCAHVVVVGAGHHQGRAPPCVHGIDRAILLRCGREVAAARRVVGVA